MVQSTFHPRFRIAAMRGAAVALVVATALCMGMGRAGRAQDTPKPEQPKMMAKEVDPDWEVVTVRPSDPKDTNEVFGMRGRHLVIEREPVEVMLRVAFGVQKSEIVGVPEWAKTELFDADGVPDALGSPDSKQLQTLLQKLLTQRFGLKFHHEQKEMGVYILTISKGGPKLVKSAVQDEAGDTQFTESSSQRRVLHAGHTTIAEFLGVMQSAVLDRPVVDRTGLAGRWDFALQWRPNDMAETSDPDPLPGLFTAIQEQMGLKLDPVKAPADVLVVDTVERPGAN